MALTNSQYDAIMHKYLERRMAEEAALNARFEEVYKNVPEYKNIEDSIASIGSSAVRDLISGKITSSDVTDSISALSAKKAHLLKEAGYPEDFLTMHYECPDCKDTGFINGQKCHCFKQAIISLLYEQSNMNSILSENNFQNLKFDYFDGENLQRFKDTVSQCHNFVQKFSLDYQNMIFYGTVGTGKSFLSGCIAKELLDKGYSVIYFSSATLFKIMSDILFDRGDRAILDSNRSGIYDCDLLIIDDLGTELTNNAVAVEIFSLLNERHLNKRSTIISTNLDLKELQERYSERIFSRLLEWYSFYKFSGPDIRQLKKTSK